MLEKSITYTDYKGNTQTETFMFNLNEAELTELEIKTVGGYSAKLETMIQQQDKALLIDVAKQLITKSYGVISPDGRRFIKSEELSTSFTQTEAYNVLFMELVSDATAIANFINGIVPSGLVQKAEASLDADKK